MKETHPNIVLYVVYNTMLMLLLARAIIKPIFRINNWIALVWINIFVESEQFFVLFG